LSFSNADDDRISTRWLIKKIGARFEKELARRTLYCAARNLRRAGREGSMCARCEAKTDECPVNEELGPLMIAVDEARLAGRLEDGHEFNALNYVSRKIGDGDPLRGLRIAPDELLPFIGRRTSRSRKRETLDDCVQAMNRLEARGLIRRERRWNGDVLTHVGYVALANLLPVTECTALHDGLHACAEGRFDFDWWMERWTGNVAMPEPAKRGEVVVFR
jgi:hypothetical protein